MDWPCTWPYTLGMRTRSQRIEVRVTPDELATLKDAAQQRGMSMADYTRLRLLGAPKAPARPTAGPPPLSPGPAPDVAVPGLSQMLDR